MEIATVTSKGQITIPASIRKALRLDKGDKVILDEKDGKVILINASTAHLDMDKLVFSAKPISTKTAIDNEDPIEWSDDVIDGKRKISL